jgi:hypothetical protein
VRGAEGALTRNPLPVSGRSVGFPPRKPAQNGLYQIGFWHADRLPHLTIIIMKKILISYKEI